MSYKVPTFSLLVCLTVLIIAYAAPEQDDTTPCGGAKEIYELLTTDSDNRPDDLIYTDMKETEGASVCRLSETCCSETAEKTLSASQSEATKQRILELWEDATTTCDSYIFKDAFTAYIEASKVSLIEILQDNFLNYFRHPTLFDEFYDYLKEAIWSGNSCQIGYKFNKQFFEIFLAVIEVAPQVETELFPTNDPDFNGCLYSYYLERSSEDIHSRFVALTRSFNRTLYYIRALNTAEDLLNTLVELEYSPQCRQAIMKSTACAQCSGLSASVVPCEELCLNVLRGCLVDYSDLFKPFSEFTRAAIAMKEYLDHNVNPFSHIDSLITVIIDMISVTAREGSTINDGILTKCLVTDTRRRRDTENDSQQRDDINSPRSLFTRATVAPPTSIFNDSAYCLLNVTPLFMTVPDTICEYVSDDRNTCWNGKILGKYDKPVLPFNRTLQQPNPEMAVCSALPKALKIQLARLEHVTQEMNIISRSHVCPEDDEDCSVDENRCDYTTYSSVSVNPTPPIPSDDDDNDDVVSGSGCLPGGVGSALESDDCIVEVEDACFVEFVEPSPSVILVPSKEPPIIIVDTTDSSFTCVPSLAVLFVSSIVSMVIVLQSIL